MTPTSLKRRMMISLRVMRRWPWSMIWRSDFTTARVCGTKSSGTSAPRPPMRTYDTVRRAPQQASSSS
jgi:hypothetical protein